MHVYFLRKAKLAVKKLVYVHQYFKIDLLTRTPA